MFRQWGKPTLIIGLTAGLGLVGFVIAQEIQQPANPNGDAGFYAYSGGIAKAKQARTQTAAQIIPESAGWVNVNGATLGYAVPVNTTDLFNVSFSAECRLVGSVVPNDYLRIRVLDNGVPMEPYDAGQAFCSADAYATHTGTWTRRVAGGVHTLQVQVWIFDGAPAGVLQAIMDDWTFEVVVYE
jgi:hypothetical protein